MAYDETLAERVRQELSGQTGVTEKKMFGGLAFLIGGNMCRGVRDDRLVLRLGNEGAAAALKQKRVAPMDLTGRIIKSMVFVDPPGFRAKAALAKWVARAGDFATSLPPKYTPRHHKFLEFLSVSMS